MNVPEKNDEKKIGGSSAACQRLFTVPKMVGARFFFQAAAVVAVAAILQLSVTSNQPVDIITVASLAAFGGNDPSAALKGKTAVITGVTSGIGEELAATLLGLGATVYGLGRSEAKLASFGSAHAGSSGTFKPVQCELSDFDSVARAAASVVGSIEEEGGSVDFLVNNAGIHYGSPLKLMSLDTTTKHGIDRSFATNYLSHVLLTELLLPLLERSGKGRVVQISSSYHWQVDGSMLAVPDKSGAMPLAADGNVVDFGQRIVSYANSKLAQVIRFSIPPVHVMPSIDLEPVFLLYMFCPPLTRSLCAASQVYHTRALARRQSGRSVTFISVCPAWVGTNIAPEGVGRRLLQLLAFPPNQVITTRAQSS